MNEIIQWYEDNSSIIMRYILAAAIPIIIRYIILWIKKIFDIEINDMNTKDDKFEIIMVSIVNVIVLLATLTIDYNILTYFIKEEKNMYIRNIIIGVLILIIVFSLFYTIGRILNYTLICNKFRIYKVGDSNFKYLISNYKKFKNENYKIGLENYFDKDGAWEVKKENSKKDSYELDKEIFMNDNHQYIKIYTITRNSIWSSWFIINKRLFLILSLSTPLLYIIFLTIGIIYFEDSAFYYLTGLLFLSVASLVINIKNADKIRIENNQMKKYILLTMNSIDKNDI